VPDERRTEQTGHSARQVANRLLHLAQAEGRTLTPMQIIKLVYLCHGWMLGLYGRPLIEDEIQAWAYGPVIRDLYEVVRQFGSGPVRGPLSERTQPLPFDDKEEDIIQQVYQGYGGMSGPALSRLTHAQGTPWSMTYEMLGQNSIISNDLIQDHFAFIAEQSPAA
jgi:uncharacterized phage-associated protein